MIYLLWPTVRAKSLADNYTIWKQLAVSKENIQIKVAVDDEKSKEILVNNGIEDVIVVDNPRHGVVTPLYELSKNLNDLNDNDIIIAASDDFVPPKNWDRYILNKYEDFTGVFKVNDGHMKNIISIPVLDFKTLKRLNKIIYHPAYNHMFSDQEMHDVVNEMGICKHAAYTDPVFAHRHYVYGERMKDDFDKRLMAKYDDSYKLYQSRRTHNLERKLSV